MKTSLFVAAAVLLAGASASAVEPDGRLGEAAALAGQAVLSAEQDPERAHREIGEALERLATAAADAQASAPAQVPPGAPGQAPGALAPALKAELDRSFGEGRYQVVAAPAAEGGYSAWKDATGECHTWYRWGCIVSPSTALLISAGDDFKNGHAVAGTLKSIAGLVVGAVLFIPGILIHVFVGTPAAISGS